MYIRVARVRITRVHVFRFSVLECTMWNMLSSNARKDHSRRIRSRWTLYSRQIQLTEINFLEGCDFLLRQGKAKKEKKGRIEDDILFSCYPRVARSLKSARIYGEYVVFQNVFLLAIFPATSSRRTSQIMRLLHDILLFASTISGRRSSRNYPPRGSFHPLRDLGLVDEMDRTGIYSTWLQRWRRCRTLRHEPQWYRRCCGQPRRLLSSCSQMETDRCSLSDEQVKPVAKRSLVFKWFAPRKKSLTSYHHFSLKGINSCLF